MQEIQTRVIYFSMHCYLLHFEEKKPCSGSINCTDSSTCCLDFIYYPQQLCYGACWTTNGAEWISCLGWIHCIYLSSGAFKCNIVLVGDKGAGCNNLRHRAACSSQSGWTNILLSGEHQSRCITAHAALNDLLFNPCSPPPCSLHVLYVILRLSVWMWGWSRPITAPRRDERYPYGDIHHAIGPWETNKGRKNWGTWRRQWLMVRWGQCDQPIIAQ